MRRKLNRSPEEMARREKISEMLQALDISSMDDIKELYRQTIAQFMENSLGSELDESLGYERYDQTKKDTENSRNGYSKKTLKTSFGDAEIAVPRDRKSEFNPQILKKNQTSVSEDIEAKIISMYAKGMTCNDINEHIKDIYGIEVSESTISRITDKVLEEAKEWQQRPLESVYAVIFWMPSTTMCAVRDGSLRRQCISLLGSIWMARRMYWVCGLVKTKAPGTGRLCSTA